MIAVDKGAHKVSEAAKGGETQPEEVEHLPIESKPLPADTFCPPGPQPNSVLAGARAIGDDQLISEGRVADDLVP